MEMIIAANSSSQVMSIVTNVAAAALAGDRLVLW